MIIDAHTHLTGHGWVKSSYLRGGLWQGWCKQYNKRHGTNLSLNEYVDMLRKTAVSPDGSYLLKIMDRAGVDHAVCFGVDWSVMTGEPRVTQQEQNKAHAELQKKHPDRFTSLGALDPRRGNVMEMAKECVEDWGLKGFYLMAAAGFQYTDPICFPLYEQCIKWGVVVILHSGLEINHWAWNHPLAVADIVCKYPELNISLGHAGGGMWLEEVIAVCGRPNAYMDLSTGLYERHPDRFYQWLRDAIDQCGADKIMWASGISAAENIAQEDWVAAIKEPKTKIKFTAEEKEWILGKSAQTLYKIKG